LNLFLGHYGIAFAAKRVAPRTSLCALAFAAQFLDELWLILLLLGVEQVRIVPGLMNANSLNFVYYPFSHSLLMAIVWGIMIAAIYSHWFLGVPMHRPDLHRSPIVRIDAATARYPSAL
jgi:hypothetical protein